MDRDTYERQRAFAGEKKPSMLRRCVDHDYTERMMYMVPAARYCFLLLGSTTTNASSFVATSVFPSTIWQRRSARINPFGGVAVGVVASSGLSGSQVGADWQFTPT